MIKRSTLEDGKKHSYYRDSTISKSEIMQIMILFHDSGYRCLKHFYPDKVCRHMRHLFPKVVSYNRIVELEKEVALPFDLYIKNVLLDKCTGITLTVHLSVFAGIREHTAIKPSKESLKETNVLWAGSRIHASLNLQ